MKIKILDNFTNAVKFIWPHIKPSYSNIAKPLALAGSFLIPFIDIIFFKSITSDTDEQNTKAESNDFNTTAMPIILLSATYCAKFALNMYLTESIKKSIQISNSEKILDSQTKFLINSESNIESLQEITIGRRVDNIASIIIPACISLPIDIISIVSSGMRIHMITNSPSALTYAFGLTLLSTAATYLIGGPMMHYVKENEAVNSTLLAKTAFIENNRESILLMGAVDFERESMICSLKAMEKEIPKFSVLSGIHFFVGSISGQLFTFLLPNNLTNGLGVASITYLNLAVGLLTNDVLDLTNMYAQGYPFLEDNLMRFQRFFKSYEDWLKTCHYNNTTFQEFIGNKGKSLSLKNFSVYKARNPSTKDELFKPLLDDINSFSEKSAILNETTISLDINKVYRLSGVSGCGKTTILKAIIKCWPYAGGKIVYPVQQDDVYFMPQKVCIPPKSTILEIIAYPLKMLDCISKYNRESEYEEPFIKKVQSLLRHFNLLPNSIQENELKSVGINWDSRLSGGEKQKLAIIRAIIKKPKLLIMDEVTIGLDDISKRAVYKVIKNEIIKKNLQNGKNSIIIYTDHNPTDDFADYVLTVDERQQLQYSDLLIGEHSHLL